jgi:hypothetical protein
MSDEMDDVELLRTMASRSREIINELDRLRAIEAWAYEQHHVKDGDKVVLTQDIATSKDRSPGWWAYRDVLVKGRTGTVRSIYLSPKGVWCGLFEPDECFVHITFDDSLMETRARAFMFPLSVMRRRKKKDKKLGMPEGVRPPYGSDVVGDTA